MTDGPLHARSRSIRKRPCDKVMLLVQTRVRHLRVVYETLPSPQVIRQALLRRIRWRVDQAATCVARYLLGFLGSLECDGRRWPFTQHEGRRCDCQPPLGCRCWLHLVAARDSFPPAAPTPREAREVRTTFEPTWHAVMDVFAQEVIPIDVLEKGSGFVAAETAVIADFTPGDSARARAMADCGRGTGLRARSFSPVERTLQRSGSTERDTQRRPRYHQVLAGGLGRRRPGDSIGVQQQGDVRDGVRARGPAHRRTDTSSLTLQEPSVNKALADDRAKRSRNVSNA